MFLIKVIVVSIKIKIFLNIAQKLLDNLGKILLYIKINLYRVKKIRARHRRKARCVRSRLGQIGEQHIGRILRLWQKAVYFVQTWLFHGLLLQLLLDIGGKLAILRALCRLATVSALEAEWDEEPDSEDDEETGDSLDSLTTSGSVLRYSKLLSFTCGSFPACSPGFLSGPWPSLWPPLPSPGPPSALFCLCTRIATRTILWPPDHPAHHLTNWYPTVLASVAFPARRRTG
ncbi:hypothetical protein BpHYR1_007655 [Brachionus plicatilis]|uniref:Uncharacterized protein n=1 Tax=Brachionus plicatilis TaxID=10195 RepID=A0A3M7T0I0_BRAPC|nr:hypothetical protein BpHYR1_007655 [Brachionus plicatilis]